MECNKECATCQTTCSIKCPVCGANGLGVESATVLNLSNKLINPMHKYYICLNPKCDTIYFDEENEYQLLKDDVKVPVWFKSHFMNYIVCYCRSIYLKDIISAVLSMNEEITKENIIKYLKKESIETNCLINNPVSRDCELLFKNAIDYALSLKQKEEDNKNVK